MKWMFEGLVYQQKVNEKGPSDPQTQKKPSKDLEAGYRLMSKQARGKLTCTGNMITVGGLKVFTDSQNILKYFQPAFGTVLLTNLNRKILS